MFDPAEDFTAVFDGLQSVTVVRPSGETTVVAAALRRLLRSGEAAPSGGQATQHDCRWNLPQTLLAQRPELGTRLRDATGDEWTVLAVDALVWGGVWRCYTRNLTLAHNLHARVALEFPLYERDQHGAAVVVEWRVARENVPASIQPIARRAETLEAARGDVATHLILLATWDSPSAQSRARDAGGRVFAIDAIERIDRLGELVQLRARRTA